MADKCFCHLNGYAVKDAEARERMDALEETASAAIETLSTGIEQALTKANTNANAITGHETRITALEGNSGGYSKTKVTLAELRTYFKPEYIGLEVEIIGKFSSSSVDSYISMFNKLLGTKFNIVQYASDMYGINRMGMSLYTFSATASQVIAASVQLATSESGGTVSTYYGYAYGTLGSLSYSSKGAYLTDTYFDFYIIGL